MSKRIYLDNNGTTVIDSKALAIYNKWSKNPINVSGVSKFGIDGAKFIDDSVNYIKKHIGSKKYEVLYTSGATESNCTIIRSIVDSWWGEVKCIPHIVTSSIEHSSILECLDALVNQDKLEITMVEPNQYGLIDERDIQDAFQDNSCLTICMFANNEIGTINPIAKIAAVSHKKKIPFHCDMTQTFGKYRVNIEKLGVDSLSMSFHKMYGPQGIGMLILSKHLVDGYNLSGLMNGKQQNGLRAGTQPVALIAASIVAMKHTFTGRTNKNKKMTSLRKSTIKILEKIFIPIQWSDIVDLDEKETKAHLTSSIEEKKEIGFCVIGPPPNRTKLIMPNTILCSFIALDRRLCNSKLRAYLEQKNITVGIGSTCNTQSKKASHVAAALEIIDVMKRGILRISFGDHNTKSDVEKLCKTLKMAFTGNKNIWK